VGAFLFPEDPVQSRLHRGGGHGGIEDEDVRSKIGVARPTRLHRGSGAPECGSGRDAG
jgi:hypothetical protein